MAAWDEEQVKILETYRNSGEERDYGDNEAVDLLNGEQVDEKRELTSEQVWAHLRLTHEIFLEFISGLPEDVFTPDSYTTDTIATESFSHYREHREDMERFKASSQ